MKDLAMMQAMIELMENALARSEERWEMYQRFGENDKELFYQGRKSVLNELLMAAYAKIAEAKENPDLEQKVTKLIEWLETRKEKRAAEREKAYARDNWDSYLMHSGCQQQLEEVLYLINAYGLRKKA